jgi:hypothetical protein
MRGVFTGSTKAMEKSEGAGQDQHNTPWPAPNVGLGFEIQRQPVRVGSPVSLPEGRVIDLYWSGYGPPIVVGSGTTYRRFETVVSGTLTLNASAGASTTILFDGTGRVRQLMVKNNLSTDRLTVTGPIFLLVGRADRVAQDYDATAGATNDSAGANWQYVDSQWIAIDPLSGAALSAECATSATTVIQSQQWIRQALASGGN